MKASIGCVDFYLCSSEAWVPRGLFDLRFSLTDGSKKTNCFAFQEVDLGFNAGIVVWCQLDCFFVSVWLVTIRLSLRSFVC